MPLVTNQYIRLGNHLQRLGAEALPACDAGPYQIDFLLCHR